MISLFSIRHPNYCPNNRDKSSTASHCRLQLSPQLCYSTVLSSHLVFAQRRCSRHSSLSPRKCGESEGRDPGRDCRDAWHGRIPVAIPNVSRNRGTLSRKERNLLLTSPFCGIQPPSYSPIALGPHIGLLPSAAIALSFPKPNLSFDQLFRTVTWQAAQKMLREGKLHCSGGL